MTTRPYARIAAAAAVAAAVVGLSLSAIAAPTAAQAAERQVVLKIDPAEVQTPEGAQRVYDRIRAAAARVCVVRGHSPVQDLQARQACRARAVGMAVAMSGRPQLVVLHQPAADPALSPAPSLDAPAILNAEVSKSTAGL